MILSYRIVISISIHTWNINNRIEKNLKMTMEKKKKVETVKPDKIWKLLENVSSEKDLKRGWYNRKCCHSQRGGGKRTRQHHDGGIFHSIEYIKWSKVTNDNTNSAYWIMQRVIIHHDATVVHRPTEVKLSHSLHNVTAGIPVFINRPLDTSHCPHYVFSALTISLTKSCIETVLVCLFVCFLRGGRYNYFPGEMKVIKYKKTPKNSRLARGVLRAKFAMLLSADHLTLRYFGLNCCQLLRSYIKSLIFCRIPLTQFLLFLTTPPLPPTCTYPPTSSRWISSAVKMPDSSTSLSHKANSFSSSLSPLPFTAAVSPTSPPAATSRPALPSSPTSSCSFHLRRYRLRKGFRSKSPWGRPTNVITQNIVPNPIPISSTQVTVVS